MSTDTERFALPDWCEELRDKDPEQLIREEGGTRERFLQAMLFSALQQRMAAAAEKSAADAALRVVDDAKKTLVRQEKKARSAISELERRTADYAASAAASSDAIVGACSNQGSPDSPDCSPKGGQPDSESTSRE